MRKYKFIGRVYAGFLGFIGHIVKNDSGLYFYAPKQCHRVEFESVNYNEVETYLTSKGYKIELIS